MKKAVIYGRVSTEDKQDYQRQVFDLKAFAQKNNYDIVEVFTEKISGTKAGIQRKEYTRMTEYLNSNIDVKTILVTELTRLGRLGTKTKLAIEEFAEKGVNIYFQDRGFYSLGQDGKMNSDTMMIIGILCDIARKEIETNINRIKSGIRYSAANNGAMSGKYRAYGFKSVNKKLVVDQDEMKVVKEMFNLYKSGLGCSQIANHLNNKGVQTRYNKIVGNEVTKTKNGYIKKGTDFSWSSGTVICILKNKLYKGERWHKAGGEKSKGELVGTFEPPIDPILFDQVQILMKNRNNRPVRMIKNDNHLKGIIKCGVCGQPYYAHIRKDGKDNAYKCLSKKNKYDGKGEGCNSPSISVPKLLDSLYSVASRSIITKLRSSKSSAASEIENKLQIKKIEIDNLKKEVKKFETKLSNLYEDYNDREISKSTYTTKKIEFENSLIKCEERLTSLVAELKHFEDLKKKPIREYYSKETFFREIKNVIKQIKISSIKPTSENKISKIFTPASTPVLITVEITDGNKINYVLGRYSKKMIFLDNKKYKVAINVKSDEPFPHAYDMMYSLDEVIQRKLGKAA